MTLAEEAMRQVRLARIALIPQGSMNSLNPVMRIKEQIADALQDHGVRLSDGMCRSGPPTSCIRSVFVSKSPRCFPTNSAVA